MKIRLSDGTIRPARITSDYQIPPGPIAIWIRDPEAGDIVIQTLEQMEASGIKVVQTIPDEWELLLRAGLRE